MGEVEKYPRPKFLEKIREDLVRPDQDFIEATNELSLDLLLETSPILADWVISGVGREIIDETKGREGEDKGIGIDHKSEKLIKEYLEILAPKYGFRDFVLLSEHKNYPFGKARIQEDGTIDNSEFIVFCDPVDNSDQYMRGIDAVNQYLVYSIFDPDYNVIAGGGCNLRTGLLFIARYGENFEFNTRTEKPKLTLLPPPSKKNITIETSDFTYSTYQGKNKYASPFNKFFAKLGQNRNPESMLNPEAGNHTYLEMARGATDIYVNFNEPLSESFAAWAFIKNMGGIVKSINRDGSSEDIPFDPRLQYARVNLLAASPYQALINTFVSFYLEAQKEEMEGYERETREIKLRKETKRFIEQAIKVPQLLESEDPEKIKRFLRHAAKVSRLLESLEE